MEAISTAYYSEMRRGIFVILIYVIEFHALFPMIYLSSVSVSSFLSIFKKMDFERGFESQIMQLSHLHVSSNADRL
jgi:hypothetical protein